MACEKLDTIILSTLPARAKSYGELTTEPPTNCVCLKMPSIYILTSPLLKVPATSYHVLVFKISAGSYKVTT